MARLSDTEMSRVAKIVKAHLAKKPYIDNRSLRQISGITYDEAIQFFGRMVKEGKLIKAGKTASTRYLLP